MSFSIVADSTAELGRELREKYNIQVIRAHFMNMDGTDKFSFNDWDECDCYASGNEFYKTLKANHDKFSTSSASIAEISDALEALVKDGQDIIAFTISSAMSGTFSFYNTAREQVLAKYPQAKIYIVDTLRFGAGIGLMAIKASELRASGMDAEAVYDFFESKKNNFHQMGWLDDLKFVAKMGRITHSKAFFGQLIGIKPLGESDKNGLTTVLGKAKGADKAFQAMISYIDKFIENPRDNIVLICHSTHQAEALKYKTLIEEKFSPKAVYIIECGPSCGIHMGPGLLSAYFYGKPLSEELSEEKSAMESILQG